MMLGLYFVYITHQADGLSVHGPYDVRDDVEGDMLNDLGDLLGGVIRVDRRKDVVDEAYSKQGYGIPAMFEGRNAVRLYLRELDTSTIETRLWEVHCEPE